MNKVKLKDVKRYRFLVLNKILKNSNILFFYNVGNEKNRYGMRLNKLNIEKSIGRGYGGGICLGNLVDGIEVLFVKYYNRYMVYEIYNNLMLNKNFLFFFLYFSFFLVFFIYVYVLKSIFNTYTYIKNTD